MGNIGISLYVEKLRFFNIPFQSLFTSCPNGKTANVGSKVIGLGIQKVTELKKND